MISLTYFYVRCSAFSVNWRVIMCDVNTKCELDRYHRGIDRTKSDITSMYILLTRMHPRTLARTPTRTRTGTRSHAYTNKERELIDRQTGRNRITILCQGGIEELFAVNRWSLCCRVLARGCFLTPYRAACQCVTSLRNYFHSRNFLVSWQFNLRIFFSAGKCVGLTSSPTVVNFNLKYNKFLPERSPSASSCGK